MASLNKVQLIGHLGKDPDLKYTPSGTAVASFSLATTMSHKGTDGEWKEKTEWHNIKVWGAQAENVSKYTHKGSLVHVEGRIETRKWEKDGQNHYITEIIADRVLYLDRKEKATDGEETSAKRQESKPTPKPPAKQDNDYPPDDESDIPF